MPGPGLRELHGLIQSLLPSIPFEGGTIISPIFFFVHYMLFPILSMSKLRHRITPSFPGCFSCARHGAEYFPRATLLPTAAPWPPRADVTPPHRGAPACPLGKPLALQTALGSAQGGSSTCGLKSGDGLCHTCHPMFPSSNGMGSPPPAAAGCKFLLDLAGDIQGTARPLACELISFDGNPAG